MPDRWQHAISITPSLAASLAELERRSSPAAAGVAVSGRFGVIGTVVGVILGLVVGTIVGRVPWALTWASMRRELARATAQELRDRTKTQYYMTHLLIAELASRGEPLNDLRGVVAAQVASEDADVRRFGEANARLWFPDLVKSE